MHPAPKVGWSTVVNVLKWQNRQKMPWMVHSAWVHFIRLHVAASTYLMKWKKIGFHLVATFSTKVQWPLSWPI